MLKKMAGRRGREEGEGGGGLGRKEGKCGRSEKLYTSRKVASSLLSSSEQVSEAEAAGGGQTRLGASSLPPPTQFTQSFSTEAAAPP